MIKIKVLLIIAYLVFGIQQSNGQVHKFVTTGFSVLEKNEKGKWGKWSDLQKASIVITLDTNKNRIIVYSQEIQLYEILNYHDKEENENDIVYPFTCKNDDGDSFTISIITRKKQKNRKQLYIAHKKAIVLYNIINFPGKKK